MTSDSAEDNAISSLGISLATATAFGLLLIVVYRWQKHRQAAKTRTYRARFVQLVAQLDAITTSVNQLSTFLPKVRDVKLVDYFESCLKILETLLTAIGKLKPFGDDPSSLDPAFFLVKDCRERILRTQQAFRDSLRGKDPDLEQLYGRSPPREAAGCYFCSRPTIPNRFARVRVKIDSQTKEVISCPICRSELEHTKKVKVLYFMKDGRPVHWSQVDDYTPSEDFWNLNKRDTVKKSTRLQLVYSRSKQDLSPERPDR